MDAMSLLKDDHIPDPSCGSGNPPGRVPQLTSFAASPKPSYSRIVPVTRLSSEKLTLSVPRRLQAPSRRRWYGRRALTDTGGRSHLGTRL